MTTTVSQDVPALVVPEARLVPVSDHLANMAPIPASRMFLIKKGLKAFVQKNPGQQVFDASQGDGGASLPGVPLEILEQAAEMQIERGTAYDMPYGTDEFRRSVIEDYWGLNSNLGYGPENILAAVGGRDALVKVYQAMLALGHGRQGDYLVVSRVPWISYNWGPYGIGANVLYAPGSSKDGWAYSEAGLRACVEFAERSGRKIAGLVITSPDNPTGGLYPVETQVSLAKAALEAGVAFVLFDWMYHYITDQQPMDLNTFLGLFEHEERERLIFLDGITKSLGASNVRNAHVIANKQVVKFIVSRASHGVIPSYYSTAVAVAAYKMGYENATRTIAEPTNASRKVLKEFLDRNHFQYILGQGYYAFIDVGDWLVWRSWPNTEPLGSYLAEEFGVAIVPGAFFSEHGGRWLRFSYATPPERTLGAAERMLEGLESL